MAAPRAVSDEVPPGLVLTEVIIALLLMAILAVSLLAGMLAAQRFVLEAAAEQTAVRTSVGALDSAALAGGTIDDRVELGRTSATWNSDGDRLVATIIRSHPPDTLRIEFRAWPPQR
jgi:type II secretory pathway pseudopilin PulG